MLKTRPFAVSGMILLICVSALTGCFGAGGQSQVFGSLDGYVYVTTGNARTIGVRGLVEDILDQTSEPLPGATVSIGGKSGTTDSDGYFSITSIPIGTYTVFITASGYHTLSIPGVAITKDQTTHLEYQNIFFAHKAWNFLVYLDGDNDLEEYAIADLNEMERIGSTDQVNILALIDRAPGHDDSNADWTTTRLYYVTKDTNTSTPSVIRSTLLAALGERDMSDPATLRDFIVYCQAHFPADKTCLTLWNHGGGVYPRSLGTADKRSADAKLKTAAKGGLRGICWDDTTGDDAWDCLTTDEVAWALSEAYNQTRQKIDVINMDVCLTQMLEVAYEWRNEVKYVVGSEGVVPGEGNDYTGLLEDLTGDPGMDAGELAKTLVDDYYTYYNSAGEDATYSYIDLGTPFAALMNRFTQFAHALNNTTDPAAPYLAWRYFTTHFDLDLLENIDLYEFAKPLSWLSEDSAVVSAAKNLMTAIAGAVYCRNSGWYDGMAYGVAIMLPTYFEWSSYSGSNQYVTLALSGATEWDEFILDFVAFTESPLSTADTLTVSITWPWGDCDLVVYDCDDYYYVDDGSSPNGTFSSDYTNGGTETWTLNQPHVPTIFEAWVEDYDYNGNLSYSINHNGIISSDTISVTAGYDYLLYYDVVKQLVRVKAVRSDRLPFMQNAKK